MIGSPFSFPFFLESRIILLLVLFRQGEQINSSRIEL